ncbi:MAG: hypothetical protein IIZ67_05400 [Bacilli bacterium]|nr:hypothetical protein [Bacilli bacterium]
MKELIKFIQKDKQRFYLEIFMILDEISKKEDIISFSYENNYLLIRTGKNDYYRVYLEREVRV